MGKARGFIVAAWASGGRVFVTGRLEDGRSFAAALARPGGALLVDARDAGRIQGLLEPFGAAEDTEPWTTMEGEPLSRFLLPGRARGGGPSLSGAERALARAGIAPRAVERGSPEELLAELGVSGGVELEGEERPGRRVEAVFVDPALRPAESRPALRWLALDIETDREESVVALSLADADHEPEVLFRDDFGAAGRGQLGPGIRAFPDEAGLLSAFAERLAARDPDVVTGWNVLDFDLRVLARRFAARGLPFALGRSDEPGGLVERPGRRLAVDLPGRAAVDAMRLHRASGERFEDQSLETVARNLLGEGKSVSATGGEKLEELDRLRRDEPAAFCSYCLRDAELVLRILAKTGLDRLTQARAALTGLSLELAWTSIPAFERVYGRALRERRVAQPPREERSVSGAAGGTVLEPSAGLYEGVLVFDFRSLYPSVMRSFNVDPLACARARGREPRDSDIVAPNGARFDREEAVLPEIIARYAKEREEAIAAVDGTAAYVYKILQNSFYGVLGAEGCRYARTELAGAVTSFGRKYLLEARAFFEARGYRVLYGDTDSVFVESRLGAEAGYGELEALGSRLALELNAELSARIRAEYGLESRLRIRCEKLYRRFFIPRLRSDAAGRGGAGRAFAARSGAGGDEEEAAFRGRAKGYAGLRLEEDGSAAVEVKGMEAARSDYTPLARRFQVGLLALVFSGAREAEAEAYCRGVAAALRRGELDGELVYRKSLRRPADEYASETPQVRAARLLGWGGMRGSVSFVMTRAGAEPESRRSGAEPDYAHYVERQLLPIARAVAEALGWDAEAWLADRPQLELGL